MRTTKTEPVQPPDRDDTGHAEGADHAPAGGSFPNGSLLEEIRQEARQAGERLRESLEDQVAGQVVLGVARMVRRLQPAIKDRARTEPPPAELPAVAVAAPENEGTVLTPAEPALGPRNDDATLAAWLERFAARREARLQRCRHRPAVAPTASPETRTAADPQSGPEPPAAMDGDDGLLHGPPAPAPPPSLFPAPTLEQTLVAAAYRLPPASLFAAAESVSGADPDEVSHNRRVIQDTLDSFGIDAEVGDAARGPRVTLYEVSPARGVKVESISAITNNLAMELAAVSLRVLTPVPGQDCVGIEVPNRRPDTVTLGTLLRGGAWAGTKAAIPLLMGRNVRGEDVILDLAVAPHLLIAGATGSGKSVLLNAFVMSLLTHFGPEDLRLLLVDPKRVEFAVYGTLPHLAVPVINDVETVVLALRWVVHEMERRYRLLAKVGVRNLAGFNQRDRGADPPCDDDGNPFPPRLPRVVLIIDELADLILTARQHVETHLARIAQMARAVGIHAIVATQRPSVNVLTGIIKANFPTRVAFHVASTFDSRTILDGNGAEALLGQGDMLFKPPGLGRLQRLQGPLVSDAEIEAVVCFAADQGTPPSDFSLLAAAGDAGPGGAAAEGEEVDEDLLAEAVQIIQQSRRASTSYLQRRLRIGYNRAASLMDVLEQRGIVGPQLGAGTREILIEPDAGAGAGPL